MASSKTRGKRCPVAPISIQEMDAAQIAPRLYQGGLEEFDGCQIAISGVNLVVKLTGDENAVKILWPDVIEYPLEDDASDLGYLPELKSLAAKLARAIKQGNNVAIFCHQGRNRSSLLTGLILQKLYRWKGDRIVSHIRSRRADAMYGGGGDDFAEYFRETY